MGEPKKVLVISYYWPPASGPGVQRVLKFVKYLPKFGWNPTVLTVKDGSYPNTDDELYKEVSETVKVYKTGTIEPFALYNSLQGKKGKSVPVAMQGIKDSSSPFQKLSKFVRANFFIPDARKYWRPFARSKALRLIHEERFDAIITTGPPHSTQLIGLDLQRRTGIPWLADFRDPWTTIYYNRFLPRSRRTVLKDRSMEDAVVKNADAVVAISATFADQLRDRSENVRLVLNGYDPSDLTEAKPPQNEKFTLAYVGNFKPNQDVPALWSLLAEMLKRDKDFKSKFCLQLVGNVDSHLEKRLLEIGLGSILEREGYVPHSEAVRKMQAADMLLFVIPQSEDNQLILTGKIFEYLAVRRPMLSIGPPDGDAAKLLNELGRETMFDYSDTSAMEEALDQAFSQWMKSGSLEGHSDKGLQNLTRESQTGQLAEILMDICGHGKN